MQSKRIRLPRSYLRVPDPSERTTLPGTSGPAKQEQVITGQKEYGDRDSKNNITVKSPKRGKKQE